MKKRLAGLLLAATVAALVIATASGLGWLVYTESGLAWLAARVVGFAGKGLTLDGVAGTLAGGASVKQIRYIGKDIEVRASEAYLRVAPASLLRLKPRLTELRAAELAVISKPTEPRGRPPDSLELPADFELPDARVARLTIDLGKGPIVLTNVQLDYSGGRRKHEVRALALQGFDYTMKLAGVIDARPPFDLKANVSATSVSGRPTEAEAAVTGNLSALNIDGSGHSGAARVQASAVVEPYAAFPPARVKAHVAALDLKSVRADLPQTQIEGDFDLDRKGSLLTGPVHLTNAVPGPYDQGRLPVSSLQMTVHTDARLAHTFELAAELGKAGAVRGSGELQGEVARFALTTKALNLAGLMSRMRETRLAGRAEFEIASEHQSVKADLVERDVRLQLVASHAADRIVIPQFRASARGGEAQGAGEVTLSGERPFAISASFARFDPHAWGDFPAGSINGSAKARGTIEGPAADVQLAIRDSRLFDAPLSAEGTLNLAREGLRRADVAAKIGGNSILARGTLGSPKDVLTVHVDGSRLDIIDKRLRGTVRADAEVTGSWRAPTVRFKLAANDLAHASYGRIQTLAAEGTASTQEDGPFDVRATLRGMSAAEWQLRSVSLRIEGKRSAHSGTLEAQGGDVNLRLRAQGGWQTGTGWTGTLRELVNSGEASANLAAPVKLTVGPQRIHVSAFDLRVIGGRLSVSGIDYERGKLSTAGRFNDMPLKTIVAIAGGPGSMAGTLRMSGQWSVENTRGWTGSINVNRESGDVALGADRTLPLGLQTLAVNATFTPEALNARANIRSAIVNGTAEGQMTATRSAAGPQFTKASPVTFTAALDVAQLAPFATFIDTAMLLEGELHARLQGAGTVSEPLVTGSITGDRIAAALPAEGIDLKGGVLKATLTQSEVRVESFSIRGGDGVLHAQGTLARTGFDEASLDWRAEKFMALARPDRRLIVSGKGNAALRGGKLAFTGALRADEGSFELATTTLPTLGNDVVIVGREQPALARRTAGAQPAEHKPLRAVVDMSLDLGNNVHLHGRGLDVWLSGDLRVQTDSNGQLRANGVIDARRGTFVAYGQRLEIDRGKFYFNGPLNDPALDIVAMRKRQTVEAGVAVTGTMARPLVRIVSNPTVPEGEALSWLVLGRAPDQAGAGQISALPLAATAVLGKAGAPIARALNLDELGVRGGTTGSNAVAQQFLTVGKRLTDRLYLAFEQSLGGTETLLRLEYSLTQRLALRAQAGVPSSVGVFYRYSWD